jgi:hypothetical protein
VPLKKEALSLLSGYRFCMAREVRAAAEKSSPSPPQLSASGTTWPALQKQFARQYSRRLCDVDDDFSKPILDAAPGHSSADGPTSA